MTKPHLALLDMLGVTVANRRWSWGGYARDGSVVLVVWKDQVHTSGRLIAYTRRAAKHRFSSETSRRLQTAVRWWSER